MSYIADIAFQLPRTHTREEMDHISDAIEAAIPDDDPLVGIGRLDQVGVMVDYDGKPSEIAPKAERILAALPEGSELISVKIEKG